MVISTSWPKAVLFDFDGVIVNSEPLHYTAFAIVLGQEGIDISEDEYYRELIGFDDRGAFEYVYQRRGRKLDDASFARVMERKGEIASELIREGRYEALPGVMEFVGKMRLRCPLAICSGARRNEIESMLQGIGLADAFPIIVAAEDVEVGKPDPRGYLLAMRLVGERSGIALSPGDCLIVEDAPSVIGAVKKVGFKTIGVTTSHGREELGGADWVVDRLSDMEVLGGQ